MLEEAKRMLSEYLGCSLLKDWELLPDKNGDLQYHRRTHVPEEPSPSRVPEEQQA